MNPSNLKRDGHRDGHALEHLGATVRSLRQDLGLSRAQLAERSGLSLRFLAQLEGGTGNISYLRLRNVARALGLDTAGLIEQAERITHRPLALIGLRGAGKSAVGQVLARRLGLPFVELDELVEEEAGMALGQIFELQGESWYRRLEREVLNRVLGLPDRAVIATGGGVVTEPETWSLLRRRAVTIWLKAAPEDHWSRVLAQGDRRPMADRPDAMAQLQRLWAERVPLYAGANLTVDTSALSVPEVVDVVLESIASHGTIDDRIDTKHHHHRQEN